MIELAATIGGSVADVRRLPHTEVMQWHAYAAKHGGLPMQRLNILLAQLCHMFNHINGGKAELRDFLPGLPEPEIPDDGGCAALNQFIDGINWYV